MHREPPTSGHLLPTERDDLARLVLPIALPVALLVALLPASLLGAAASPPDLRLEWTVEGRGSRQAPALRGEAGETVTIDYAVRNVGGSDAFAAIVNAYTALGSRGGPRRLQPGPKAGATLRRELSLALAVGMRELCLTVRLQNLELADPDDPNPEDNRLCRAVEVTPRSPEEDVAVVAGRRASALIPVSPVAASAPGTTQRRNRP